VSKTTTAIAMYAATVAITIGIGYGISYATGNTGWPVVWQTIIGALAGTGVMGTVFRLIDRHGDRAARYNQEQEQR